MKLLLQICLIGILFLINGLSACTKSTVFPDDRSAQLSGEWTWVNSSGGIGGTMITPASAGYSQEISYTDKGIFRHYKDGKREQRSTFGISPTQGSTGNIYPYTIIYGEPFGPATAQPYLIRNDSLFLMDNCADCYSHTYVRKK